MIEKSKRLEFGRWFMDLYRFHHWYPQFRFRNISDESLHQIAMVASWGYWEVYCFRRNP